MVVVAAIARITDPSFPTLVLFGTSVLFWTITRLCGSCWTLSSVRFRFELAGTNISIAPKFVSLKFTTDEALFRIVSVIVTVFEDLR